MQRFRLSFVLLPLVLFACSQPATERPTFTDAELQHEQEEQATAAMKAPRYFNAQKNYGYKQVDAMDARLGPVAQRVQRAAASMCNEMRGGQVQDEDDNCIFSVVLNPREHALNAHTDGHVVTIAPAMVDFLANSNQLAFVVSHEMGHNIMRHVAQQKDNAEWGAAFGMVGDVVAGMNRVNSKGAFSKIGGQQAALTYSPQFEAEADYVGLYIMARAGYKIEDAPNVWRMMSQAQPDAIYVARTHPNNPARTIAMEKTVTEIRAKQHAGQPLIPTFHADAS